MSQPPIGGEKCPNMSKSIPRSTTTGGPSSSSGGTSRPTSSRSGSRSSNSPSEGKSTITLDELALPFSAHICRHLKLSDRQATSRSSRFLDTCRKFNAGEVRTDELVTTSVKLGFNNVIDAFHVVNQGEVGVRFFADARAGPTGGIRLTDEVFRLLEQYQGRNLPQEIEAQVASGRDGVGPGTVPERHRGRLRSGRGGPLRERSSLRAQGHHVLPGRPQRLPEGEMLLLLRRHRHPGRLAGPGRGRSLLPALPQAVRDRDQRRRRVEPRAGVSDVQPGDRGQVGPGPRPGPARTPGEEERVPHRQSSPAPGDPDRPVRRDQGSTTGVPARHVRHGEVAADPHLETGS